MVSFLGSADERESPAAGLDLDDLQSDAATAADKDGFVDARAVFKSPKRDMLPPATTYVFIHGLALANTDL